MARYDVQVKCTKKKHNITAHSRTICCGDSATVEFWVAFDALQTQRDSFKNKLDWQFSNTHGISSFGHLTHICSLVGAITVAVFLHDAATKQSVSVCCSDVKCGILTILVAVQRDAMNGKVAKEQ